MRGPARPAPARRLLRRAGSAAVPPRRVLCGRAECFYGPRGHRRGSPPSRSETTLQRKTPGQRRAGPSPAAGCGPGLPAPPGLASPAAGTASRPFSLPGSTRGRPAASAPCPAAQGRQAHGPAPPLHLGRPLAFDAASARAGTGHRGGKSGQAGKCGPGRAGEDQGPGREKAVGQRTRPRPLYLLRRVAASDDGRVAVRALQRRGRPGGAGRAHPPAAGAVGPHPVVRHAAVLLLVGRGLEARQGLRQRLRARRRLPARWGLRQRRGLRAGQGPGQRLRTGQGPAGGGERAVALLAPVVLLMLLLEVRGQRQGLQLLLAPVHPRRAREPRAPAGAGRQMQKRVGAGRRLVPAREPRLGRDTPAGGRAPRPPPPLRAGGQPGAGRPGPPLTAGPAGGRSRGGTWRPGARADCPSSLAFGSRLAEGCSSRYRPRLQPSGNSTVRRPR